METGGDPSEVGSCDGIDLIFIKLGMSMRDPVREGRTQLNCESMGYTSFERNFRVGPG